MVQILKILIVIQMRKINGEKKKIDFISDNEIKINLDGKFVTERGRINCSLRENTGEWRWLGIQFVISDL